EPAVAEGNRFFDISNGCTGSNRSNPPNYSLFLPAVRDTRAADVIVTEKIEQLLATVATFRSAGFITPPNPTDAADPRIASSDCETELSQPDESMEHEIQAASASLVGDAARGNCALRNFIKIVDTNPGNYHDTVGIETRTAAGELKSRALSAIFFLCKLAPD